MHDQPSLYAKQEKIHPRKVTGWFAMWRTTGVVVLLGIYYGVPWLRWDGHQAVLLDLPERKFYIFALTFWPQDFFYFAILLILAALSLFFFTALAGRLWCGYACPQTVWTEVFLAMERWVEGDRMQQIKLDASPWNREKIAKRTSKHVLWLVFAAYTGFTFVGYFTPIDGIANRILALDLGPWETFWIVFYSFATYGNAGWLREQVCIYMCPYARFQSAMFDRDTLIIAYDDRRGEPRGSRKKGQDYKASGLGDCVNCTLCKQVCPTGIDIRDGLQYQCIACAACIDVCDQVMEKIGYEKGLIKYTTENAVEGKPSHILRFRIVVYAVIMVILIGAFVYGLVSRLPLEMDVIRDRNALFRETLKGEIENVYTLKLINMDEVQHQYSLMVEGLEGIEMEMNHDSIIVPAGEVAELPVWLRVPASNVSKRSTKIKFTLVSTSNPDLRVVEEARFLGPVPGR